jgi:hypothetical protein
LFIQSVLVVSHRHRCHGRTFAASEHAKNV